MEALRRFLSSRGPGDSSETQLAFKNDFKNALQSAFRTDAEAMARVRQRACAWANVRMLAYVAGLLENSSQRLADAAAQWTEYAQRYKEVFDETFPEKYQALEPKPHPSLKIEVPSCPVDEPDWLYAIQDEILQSVEREQSRVDSLIQVHNELRSKAFVAFNIVASVENSLKSVSPSVSSWWSSVITNPFTQFVKDFPLEERDRYWSAVLKEVTFPFNEEINKQAAADAEWAPTALFEAAAKASRPVVGPSRTPLKGEDLIKCTATPTWEQWEDRGTPSGTFAAAGAHGWTLNGSVVLSSKSPTLTPQEQVDRYAKALMESPNTKGNSFAQQKMCWNARLESVKSGAASTEEVATAPPLPQSSLLVLIGPTNLVPNIGSTKHLVPRNNLMVWSVMDVYIHPMIHEDRWFVGIYWPRRRIMQVLCARDVETLKLRRVQSEFFKLCYKLRHHDGELTGVNNAPDVLMLTFEENEHLSVCAVIEAYARGRTVTARDPKDAAKNQRLARTMPDVQYSNADEPEYNKAVQWAIENKSGELVMTNLITTK